MVNEQALTRAREIVAIAAANGHFPAVSGRKAELAVHHGARVLSGKKPSASAACRSAGIPVGTVGPWRTRDPGLKAALEFWNDSLDFEGFRAKAQRLHPAEPVVPDFLTFRAEYFAYRDGRTGRWTRAVNNWYQRDFIGKLDDLLRGVLILPPGHIKTSLVIEYVTWRIFQDRDFRGLGVQKNQGEASKLVAAVQERLDCDYYHHAAEKLLEQEETPITCPVCTYAKDQPFKPESKDRGAKWGAQAFRVSGRTSGEKDDTFAAYGVGSQIMGVRSDLIVLDDPQDPMDAIRSPKSSEEMLEWFQTVILSRVYDHQRVIVLGNFITPDDFAHRLIDTYGERWAVVKYAAIRDCEEPDCSGDYETCEHTRERILCPEVWTWDGLMAKKQEVGERAWFYTWAQDEGSFDTRTFTREAMEDAKTNDYRLGEVPHDVTDFWIGVDPAAAASGHCAIVGWGLDRHAKQRYLLSIFNERGMRTWDNVIDAIQRIAVQLTSGSSANFRAVVIERTNTQATLINDTSLHRAIRGMGAQVIEYRTRTGMGAQAERDSFDISTIGGLYDAGLVSLPYGGTFAEREAVDGYVEQFLAWRVDEQGRSIKHLKRDMVMATLFAESEAFNRANMARERTPWRRNPHRFAQESWGRFGTQRPKAAARLSRDRSADDDYAASSPRSS
jgi:hypothetical protein